MNPAPAPRRLAGLAALLIALATLQARAIEFTIAGDMRHFTAPTAESKPGQRYFDGVCEAIKRVGPGAFLLSPGDYDPPAQNRAMIDRYFGRDFVWYTVVGNHEVENAAVMPWVHQWMAGDIPGLVRRGVPGTQLTVYSWDAGDSHFVAIDSYPFAKPGLTGNKGRVATPDVLLKWIDDDLAATHQRFRWVTGHQPIQPLPDMDSGRLRHDGESVSSDPAQAARFVELLKRHHVRAYLCGHTHNASVARLKSGIWQVDSGHARGAGDPGSPSTFVKIRTEGDRAWCDVYRGDRNGANYRLRTTVELTADAGP